MRTQIILAFAGFLISLSQAQVATPVATAPACPSDCIVPCVTYQLSNTCLERCGCTQAQADEAVKKAQTPAAEPIQPTPVVPATAAQPVATQPAAPAQNSFLSSFLEPAKGYLGTTPAAAPASGTSASATPATGAPTATPSAQGGFNFSDLSTLLDKFKSQNAPPQNTQESLTAALASQPLGQYAVTSEPDGRYTLIPIGGSGIVQANVTKNETTYTTSANANEQIAVVCSGGKSSCLGLSFADGVLKGVKNVSVTSETGPVKMVTVSEAVTSAPVATPVVAAPVATPVVTPIVDAPVAVPVETPVVTLVVEAAPVPVVESVGTPVEIVAPIATPEADSQTIILNQTEALTALFTSYFEGQQQGFLAKQPGESESTSWFSAIWIILALCVLGAAYDTFGRSLFQTLAKKRTSFRFSRIPSRKEGVQESLLGDRNESDYFKFV